MRDQREAAHASAESGQPPGDVGAHGQHARAGRCDVAKHRQRAEPPPVELSPPSGGSARALRSLERTLGFPQRCDHVVVGLAQHLNPRRVAALSAAKHHARLDGAVPYVALEPEGRVYRLSGFNAETAVAAESDSACTGTAGADAKACVTSLAHGAQ